MREITIPVVTEAPVMAGPGSQPAELDGAELDILQLPSGMDSYQAPLLPEPEEMVGLEQGQKRLAHLLEQLRAYRPDAEAPEPIDLADLDSANRQLIDQVLGEGEVSMRCEGAIRARIQESVLAGVWRVRYVDEQDRVQRDCISIGAVPGGLPELAFAAAAETIDGQIDDLPDGVLNAPSLLAELNDKIAAWRPGSAPHVLNLTLLPQTEQDLAFLADRLGQGLVTILSRGYGNCRITSTATRRVWWVQYFNSQDKNILNTLEVTDVPSVACAAPEDIRDSAERLAEILEIYQ